MSVSTFTALLCGILFSAALPAVGWWPLSLALVPFFVAVAKSETSRGAFGLGFLFGVAFFTLHIFWLPRSFADIFGGVFWLTFPPLVALLGCFWGLVTFGARLLGGRGVGTLLVLPALWVLMEWARTQGVFAFPWGTLGYMWLDTPVSQLADLTGVYGLSLLTAGLASLLSVPFVVRRHFSSSARAASVGALGVLLVAFGYGGARLGEVPVPTTKRALLVQGNLDPFGRTVTVEGELDVYTRLTRRRLAALDSPPELVVWPEGVSGNLGLPGQGAADDRALIQEGAAPATVITGGTAAEGGRYFNSVYSLEDGAVTGRYDKIYLVPFGEAFPLIGPLEPLYRAIFNAFGLGMLSSRSPGAEILPLETPDGVTATYVCYESITPQVARAMVRLGAEVLINISNDAWFGRGLGAEQHFQMGRLRAIETRRYLLRAGNNGITALIDPYGRVVERFPRGVEGTLLAEYGLSDTLTPYVRYGDWLVGVLALYAAGFVVVATVRTRRSRLSPA